MFLLLLMGKDPTLHVSIPLSSGQTNAIHKSVLADSPLGQYQEHPKGQNLTRKMGKDNYQVLVSDLSSHGYSTKFLTRGIGCLGHYTQDVSQATLNAAAPLSQGSDRHTALIETCSKGSHFWQLSDLSNKEIALEHYL